MDVNILSEHKISFTTTDTPCQNAALIYKNNENFIINISIEQNDSFTATLGNVENFDGSHLTLSGQNMELSGNLDKIDVTEVTLDLKKVFHFSSTYDIEPATTGWSWIDLRKK